MFRLTLATILIVKKRPIFRALILLIFLATSKAEVTNRTTIKGCSSVYKSKYSNLLMDVVSNGGKEITVKFLYSGEVPFGFHLHPDPNKVLKIKNNYLTHSKKNRVGQITFTPEKKIKSLKFKLTKKIGDLDYIEFDNSATLNLGFKENIIPITTDKLRLCSWIRK